MHDDDRRDRPIKIDMTVTVHVPALAGINAQLAQILAMLGQSARREEAIMATQQDILTEIADESTIADSILALVQRLVTENDPAARQAILDALKANRTKLEAAVLAGTPQEPPA